MLSLTASCKLLELGATPTTLTLIGTFLVLSTGFEPITYRLQGGRSANYELPEQNLVPAPHRIGGVIIPDP